MAKVRNRSIKATQTRKRVQKHRNLKKLRAAYEKEVAFVEHSNFNQNANGTTSEKQSDVHDGPDLKANLRSWAVKNRITQAAINDLLSILIISGLSFLPKDARTLMQTPTSVNIFPLTSGKMWYQSLRATLRSVFAKLDRNLKIHLDFNFDGMPLFNSSKLKFWPILAAVREFPEIKPLIIGIWCGEGDPPLNEYLTPLISELKEILADGIVINEHYIAVNFGMCICDTPARAFIKGVMNFNGKHGCQKCISPGEYSKKFHRMSFPKIDGARRTNATFRTRTQAEHHKQYSLMEELNIDMVNSFPTSDPLHLLDLGVMKTCLVRWARGKKGYDRKWTKDLVQAISKLLITLNKQKPTEVHRAFRSLDTLRYWKGVEFRTFLLYTGMVVLKDALSSIEYTHFLTLCCAVTICSCKIYKQYIPLARKMFDAYINAYIEIYGRDTISSNIHNLCHITEDMENHNIGNLIDISTYKFENSLRLMGLDLRNCNLPLEQIARRVSESFNLQNQKKYNSEDFSESFPRVQYESIDSNRIEGYKMYHKIIIKPNVMLSNRKLGDQWFLTRRGDIVQFKYAIAKGSSFQICGARVQFKEAFFSEPIISTNLFIYQSNGEVCDEITIFDLNEIISKLICLTTNQNSVFMPLLHTLEVLN